MNIKEFRRLDVNYSHFIGDPYVLMENAGKSVAEFCIKTFGNGKKILIIGGSGNKCGDSLVAAEILRKSNSVNVALLRGREGIKAKMALRALNNYHGSIVNKEELPNLMENSDIILDGLLGTGISGEVREPYRSVIDSINRSGKTVVSIDVPSGFPGDLHVTPSYTLTFHAMKDGMDEKNSGKISVVDIGIPADMVYLSGPGDFIYLPIPKKESHKGMNGILGIVGGWTYHGSAVISAFGALATAPDLVNIFAPQDMKNIISGYSAEIITRTFTGIEDFLQTASRMKCIVIGPGMGISGEKEEIVTKIVQNVHVPVVIDADAIHMMSNHGDLFSSNMIFTPHAGEFRVLTGKDANRSNLEEFSKKYECVVILKGSTDMIAKDGRVYFTEGGNSRLTMGGTGDLLTGILGGFLSKGIDPVVSSRMATYTEKRAAEMAFQKKSYWYSVSDLIEEIPSAIRESWEKCIEPS